MRDKIILILLLSVLVLVRTSRADDNVSQPVHESDEASPLIHQSEETPPRRYTERATDPELTQQGFTPVGSSGFYTRGGFTVEKAQDGTLKLYANFPFDFEAQGPHRISPKDIKGIRAGGSGRGSHGISLDLFRNGREEEYLASLDGSRRYGPMTESNPSSSNLSNLSLARQLLNAGFSRDRKTPSVFRKKEGSYTLVVITAGNRVRKILRSLPPQVQEAIAGGTLSGYQELPNDGNPFGDVISFLKFDKNGKIFYARAPRMDGEKGTIVPEVSEYCVPEISEY